jgi:hypothetical protein
MEVTTEVIPTTHLVPAQPTPPAPKPGEAGDMTKEQIEKASQEMLEVMGMAPMSEETRAAEMAKGQPKSEPATTTQRPATPPIAAPAATVPEVKPPQRKRLDIEGLVQKTATAVAEKINGTAPQPPATQPSPAPAKFEMTPDDKNDNDVLTFMEKKGQVAKGTTAKHAAFVQALAEYRAKWEKAHEGQEFDADADEHNDFYAKNQPEFDAVKFEEAAKEWDFEKRYQARARDDKSAQDEQIKTIQRDRRVEKIMPAIITAQANAIADMIKDADPDAFKLVSDANGGLDLNQGTLAKLMQYNRPLALRIVESAKNLDAAIEELRKFSDTEMQKLDYRFNPAGNQVHSYIAEIAHNSERLMLSAPAEKQIRDGKKFISGRDWNAKMNETHNDPEKRRDFKSKFWTFTPDDLEQLVIASEKGSVKGKVLEFEEYAESRAKARGAQPPAKAPETAPTTVPTPAPTQDRIAPPNLASSADTVTTHTVTLPGEKSFAETAAEVAFS